MIVKRKNGKSESYGTFKTLKEAQNEVELLKKYNWDLGELCDLNE